jgi:hypothetical protein
MIVAIFAVVAVVHRIEELGLKVAKAGVERETPNTGGGGSGGDAQPRSYIGGSGIVILTF